MFAKFRLLFTVAMVSAAAAQDQSQLRFTARELFYAAVSAPPKSTPKKAVPARKPQAAAAAPEKAHSVPESPVIPVAAKSPEAPAGAPLGLKYSILKLSGQGMIAVSPDTVFHAGDRIQLSVETNSAGYLYVISQGSSGVWKTMFPLAEIAEGDNQVEPFHQYLLPPKSRMLFDEQTGEERLFIVLSREPEASLEKMIYSLPGGTPPSTPSPARKTLVSAGGATIDNHTVGLLRTAYSRDLVIEKVEASTDNQEKETAVYVVNPSGSPDSRLVADLRLAHR